MVWPQVTIFSVVFEMRSELMASGCGEQTVQGQYARKKRSGYISKSFTISCIEKVAGHKSHTNGATPFYGEMKPDLRRSS